MFLVGWTRLPAAAPALSRAGLASFGVCLLGIACVDSKTSEAPPIRVRVVDYDKGQPVANAGVALTGRYPDYSPGFMQNVVSGKRCYWLRADEQGMAEIPVGYFRIEKWKHHWRRPAAIPVGYDARAWRSDYTADGIRFSAAIPPDTVPEIRIKDESGSNFKEGVLHQSYGYDYNEEGRRVFDSRTDFHYRFDAASNEVVVAESAETADFLVRYEIIPFEGARYDHCRPTDREDTCKRLLGIETFGRGGVAIDPRANAYFATLRDASSLAYERARSLKGRFRIQIVKTRDAAEYLALRISDNDIRWLVNPGKSYFYRGISGLGREESIKHAPRAGPASCRKYDPAIPPDSREWVKER